MNYLSVRIIFILKSHFLFLFYFFSKFWLAATNTKEPRVYRASFRTNL
jgi:hypothetical protein